MDIFNNQSLYIRTTLILAFVFLILKFGVKLQTYEAILLTFIIIVSILIIENVIQLNNITKDPFGCDSCKVNLNNNNVEQFDNVTSNNLISTSSNNDSKNVKSIDGDGRDYVCYPINNTPVATSFGISVTSNNLSSNTSTDSPITTINSLLSTATDTSPSIDTTISSSNNSSETPAININNLLSSELTLNNTPSQTDSVSTTSSFDTLVNTVSSNNLNITTPPTTTENSINQLEHFLVEKHNSFINPDGSQSIDINKPDVTTNFNPSIGEQPYVTYQQSNNNEMSDEEKDQSVVIQRKMERLREGNADIVNSYVDSGKKTYQDIYTRSTGAAKPDDLMQDEYKYGDFNYIAPINRGMMDKTYTYVSPNNWYPIPPHPPVCVTNNKCTTSPVIISNGENYMNFASIEDFDKSRRFTGSMNINIDYVKDVLNNPNGY